MYHTNEDKRHIGYFALLIIVVLISCIFLSACNKQKKVSSARYGYISYVIQWDSILKYNAPKETLRFCFYPLDNGPMIQTDTDSITLKMALAPGKYGLLVYNYGEDHFLLKNRTDFKRAEATFATNVDGCSLMPSVPLYGAVIREFEIKANQDITTVITPTLFTKQVYFNIDLKDDHFEYIHDCQGMLTGVTPLLHVCNRTVKRETTTILPVFLEKNGNSYQGKILLLDGTYEGNNREAISNELTLNFLMQDGSTIISSINMGASIFNIKKQDILVDIHASIDMDSDKKIILDCESIDIHKKVFNQ